MAVYNGSSFLREQLASIIPQLDEEDEIVIVDDCSEDQSVSIIRSFQDARIKLLLNETNRGVLKAFETALLNAKHDLLFLCDQDDVWRADKVQKFKHLFALNSGLSLAASDARIIDAEGQLTEESFYATRPFHTNLLLNVLRNRFLGCTMVFRRGLLGYCLPFPADTPMHDMWIGMVNQLVGRSTFIPEPLVSYRRHGNNATGLRHASLARMVRWRFALIKNLARLYLQFIIQGRPLTIPGP